MIEAKELRIGNLVYDPSGNVIIVTATWIKEQQQCDVSNCDYLKPIPITEEWLLKFGMKNGYLGPIRRVYGLVKGTENDFELCFEIGRLDFRTIKYIHQLQNLYFALTQTELELK